MTEDLVSGTLIASLRASSPRFRAVASTYAIPLDFSVVDLDDYSPPPRPPCAFCAAVSPDDERGNCGACGAPRGRV
jgi:hypothetical protein